MGILLGAGDFDVPHPFPGLVQPLVNRVNAGVMRTYAVTASRRYPVIFRELFVQCHVQLQMRHILVEMGLLVIPHVRKPGESVSYKPLCSRKLN